MVWHAELFYNESMNGIMEFFDFSDKRISGKTRSCGRLILFCLLLSAVMLLPGCGADAQNTPPSPEKAVASAARPVSDQEVRHMNGTRDSTPEVLVPEQTGIVCAGTEDVMIDSSNQAEGYVSICYTGEPNKIKVQIKGPDRVTYTYSLAPDGNYYVFPLSAGDGHYVVGVYSNIEASMYAEVYCTELDVQMNSPYRPFLYPNQYVWFTEDTKAVAVAEEICRVADTDLDCINLVYNYVVQHVTYDWEEAQTVASGYLPDVDEVLETGKGICFDYAALMSSMLRSQRIPTHLEIGYAGTAYHAWIAAYVDEIGWVNGIIQFDGVDWSIMDPTLAASQGEKALKSFIGDGSNYRTVYTY